MIEKNHETFITNRACALATGFTKPQAEIPGERLKIFNCCHG